MTVFTKQFDSISSMARFIESTPRHPDCNDSSESHRAKQSWDNGVDFNGALAMAKTGGRWDEGASDLVKAHTDMAALKAEAEAPDDDYDITGHTLDIGAYLSGQPDCFINDGDEDTDRKPVLRLAVQIGRGGHVEAESIMNRGAGILSLVDDLEDQGVRVELTALWVNHSRHCGDTADIRVIVKEAQDQWSAASVAFALCHPSFNRRLTWRVAETSESMRGLTRGYGRGVEPSNPLLEEYDAVFKWQTASYRTRKDAMIAMKREFNTQLEKRAA